MNSKIKLSVLAVLFSSLCPTSGADPLQIKIEGHASVRSSGNLQVETQFPFPPEALPVGQNAAFLETVEEGSHVEVSKIRLLGAWQPFPYLGITGTVDTIDLYDRNPTSSDRKIDLDSLIVRLSAQASPTSARPQVGEYIQLGKFAKFERNDQRPLENYGLVATAFNRFEDSGLEAGLYLDSGWFFKATYTTGNPLFIRDANALAGDNGTSARILPPNNPDPKLKSGLVILYDAEIESFDLSENPEVGINFGYISAFGRVESFYEFSFWAYERNLAATRELHGTFYDADLDLLAGAAGFSLPISGNDKSEYGFSYRYQDQSANVFLQYVEQENASLPRKGFELEYSHDIALPFTWTWGDKALVKSMIPVFRYSTLRSDFVGDPTYPAPSVFWDWQKWDLGVRFYLQKQLSLSLEFSHNRFTSPFGADGSANEVLMTVSWSRRLK